MKTSMGCKDGEILHELHNAFPPTMIKLVHYLRLDAILIPMPVRRSTTYVQEQPEQSQALLQVL